MKFRVEPKIFEKFPGVRIGILVVLGMDNSQGQAEISKLLNEEEKAKQQEFSEVNLKEHPKITPWREIYRQFGSKPQKYRSSVEALLRRVVGGNKLPRINPLVDLYNYISIKHVVPVGAEDLDKIKREIVLGFAQGNEQGKYINSDEVVTCSPGEVIYKDDLGFICRRWNWREGDRTKIEKGTKNAVVVIEANQNIPDKELESVLEETAELIEKHLNAKVKTEVLDTENMDFDIDFEPGKRLAKEELVIEKELGKPTKKLEKEVKEYQWELVNKESFVYKLRELIYKVVVDLAGKRAITFSDVIIEHPANPEHGDYATNVAMVTFKKRPKVMREEIKLPLDWANKIVNTWRLSGLPEYIAKIEVVKPGFINLWLENKFFINQVEAVLKDGNKYGSSSVLVKKKILLEHTSPNPQTTIMFGHLRNNFLGMTIANIFEFLGAKVTKDCVVNDRGIHLCRAMWGYLVFGRKRGGLKKSQTLNFRKVTDSQIKKESAKVDWEELLGEWNKKKSNWWMPSDLGLKSDHTNLIWYVLGSKAYNLLPEVKKQVEAMLIVWEKEDKKILQLWRQLLDWSAKGYQETYERVGSLHDHVWYESDHYKKGKEIVKEGLKKKVFRESEGAVVTDLAKYNLPDTVVVKSDGTALYITQDLALTKLKIKKFPSDLYIWDVSAEQDLYFKQLFTICEQLGIGRKEKLFHLSYALINFKGGKRMSTRRGDIIKSDEILDELHQRALKLIKTTDQELRGKLNKKQLDDLAETVALGAIKYSLLKYARETTIYFDIDESLALEGNSGPYLQYTYARCQSVLKKAKSDLKGKSQLSISGMKLNDEEMSLLRTIYQFPEVAQEAGENYAPNLICNFLYDLAQKYNLFYNKHSILKAKNKKSKDFRLALTVAVSQILKNGLNLLGIQTPERM